MLNTSSIAPGWHGIAVNLLWSSAWNAASARATNECNVNSINVSHTQVREYTIYTIVKPTFTIHVSTCQMTTAHETLLEQNLFSPSIMHIHIRNRDHDHDHGGGDMYS